MRRMQTTPREVRYSWSCDGESNSGLRDTNPPLCQLSYHSDALVPAHGIEPYSLAFQTSAITTLARQAKTWSGRRDSNSRPRLWQGRVLAAELRPHEVWLGGL